MFTVTSTLHLGHLAKLTDDLKDELQQVCDRTALSIEHDAKQDAPVDTGFLRRSIHSDTSEGSDYSGEGDALPAVQRPPGISAAVGVAAPYGWFVEHGTHKMAAQPYFTPAVERQRQRFVEEMRQVID